MNIEGDSAKQWIRSPVYTYKQQCDVTVSLLFHWSGTEPNLWALKYSIDWLVPLVTFSINPCTPKNFSRICRFFSRHVLMYWWGQWGGHCSGKGLLVLWLWCMNAVLFRNQSAIRWVISEYLGCHASRVLRLAALSTTRCLGRKILKQSDPK